MTGITVEADGPAGITVEGDSGEPATLSWSGPRAASKGDIELEAGG